MAATTRVVVLMREIQQLYEIFVALTAMNFKAVSVASWLENNEVDMPYMSFYQERVIEYISAHRDESIVLISNLFLGFEGLQARIFVARVKKICPNLVFLVNDLNPSDRFISENINGVVGAEPGHTADVIARLLLQQSLQEIQNQLPQCLQLLP